MLEFFSPWVDASLTEQQPTLLSEARVPSAHLSATSSSFPENWSTYAEVIAKNQVYHSFPEHAEYKKEQNTLDHIYNRRQKSLN